MALLLLLWLSMALAPLAPSSSGANTSHCFLSTPESSPAISPADVELLQFFLNFKFVEAEWFLHGALGHGIDGLDRGLAQGGPSPAGAKKANLDARTREVVAELGYQEIGHIRLIRIAVGTFPRPLINLSEHYIAAVMDRAMGTRLDPPFKAYSNRINFLLASYLFPSVAAATIVGVSFHSMGYLTKRILSSILSVEAGQDAVIRTLLYEHADEVVPPYRPRTVADFTRRISAWHNAVAGCGDREEGLGVGRRLGAERRAAGNVVGADEFSAGFGRTPAEALRIVYGTGSERRPGGFLPRGANGTMARGFFEVA